MLPPYNARGGIKKSGLHAFYPVTNHVTLITLAHGIIRVFFFKDWFEPTKYCSGGKTLCAVSNFEIAGKVVFDGWNDGLHEFKEDEEINVDADLIATFSAKLDQLLHHVSVPVKKRLDH